MATTDRPYNLTTRNQVAENYDTQVVSLAADHVVSVLFTTILTAAVLTWRTTRAARVDAATYLPRLPMQSRRAEATDDAERDAPPHSHPPVGSPGGGGCFGGRRV